MLKLLLITTIESIAVLILKKLSWRTRARVVPGVAVQLYYGKIFKDQAL
jgi:hypothetical protein